MCGVLFSYTSIIFRDFYFRELEDSRMKFKACEN